MICYAGNYRQNDEVQRQITEMRAKEKWDGIDLSTVNTDNIFYVKRCLEVLSSFDKLYETVSVKKKSEIANVKSKEKNVKDSITVCVVDNRRWTALSVQGKDAVLISHPIDEVTVEQAIVEHINSFIR